VQQPALVSIPSKSQLIATSSCLKAPRVPHMNDLTMSGHLGVWKRVRSPLLGRPIRVMHKYSQKWSAKGGPALPHERDRAFRAAPRAHPLTKTHSGARPDIRPR